MCGHNIFQHFKSSSIFWKMLIRLNTKHYYFCFWVFSFHLFIMWFLVIFQIWLFQFSLIIWIFFIEFVYTVCESIKFFKIEIGFISLVFSLLLLRVVQKFQKNTRHKSQPGVLDRVCRFLVVGVMMFRRKSWQCVVTRQFTARVCGSNVRLCCIE